MKKKKKNKQIETEESSVMHLSRPCRQLFRGILFKRITDNYRADNEVCDFCRGSKKLCVELIPSCEL